MNIQRDIQTTGHANKRTKPRLSAAKKEELMQIMQRLRFLVGTAQDTKAHTVQIVFTSDKTENVVTLTEN